MASTIDDVPTWEGVSRALDQLGNTVGAILVRGPDGWTIIEPGPAGTVLTSTGPGQVPAWLP